MNRPFTESDEGDRWFMDLLGRSGYTRLRRTDRYCHWDVEGYDRNGNLVVFELKNRDFPSSRFGDICLSKDRWLILRHHPCKSFLVTFFEDGWVIIDLKELMPSDEIIRVNRRTTRLENDSDFRHRMVVWKIEQTRLLNY